MPNYTQGLLELYIPSDMQNDDFVGDFLPGLTDNFEKLEDTIPIVTPQLYGALGDSSNEDNIAFQQCLDLALSNDGVTILIPPGYYRMYEELRIYEGTKIIAHPDANIYRSHGMYLMLNGDRGASYSGYNGNGDIHIQGGVWSGNAGSVTQKASIFAFAHSHDCVFRDMTFKDVYNSHHIEVNSSKNVTFDNCKFIGGVYEQTYNEAIQLDLAKSSGVFNAFGAYDQTPCQDVSITNCYFGPSGTSGTTAPGRAIGSHSSTIGYQHKNITINGNVIEDTLTWAIRLYNTRSFAIGDNVITNCGQGINARAAITGTDTEDENGTQVGAEVMDDGTITGNVIRGGLGDGRAIEVYGEQGSSGRLVGIIVSGNTINSVVAGNDAIQFHFAERCTCFGNRIYGTQDGIAVNDSVDMSITGNSIDAVSQYGIQWYGGSKFITVSNNSIRRADKSLIYTTDSSESVISGNMLAGPNQENAADSSTNNHIRLTSGVDKVAISGNTLSQAGGGDTTHGIYVTSSCTNVSLTGNVGTGYTLYNGANQPTDTHGNIGTVT